MRMTVNVGERVLIDTQRKLGEFKNKAPNAIASALNRSATNINSNISKEARKRYVIKASDIKSTLSKTKASRSRLSAVVKSEGKLIGLDKFKVTPKTVDPKRKKPIKIGVKKNGVKKVLGAFVADIHGTKIFKRTDKARLPIQRLLGPSVPQMIGNPEVKSKIEQEGYDTFNKRLDHEINRILDRGRATS
jgi:hypothetical protein